jgi:hypothetical protein
LDQTEMNARSPSTRNWLGLATNCKFCNAGLMH